MSDLAEVVEASALVDHHCHAVVAEPLDRAAFELLLGESGRPAPPGCSMFDTNLGLAVRAWCAPVLDLAPGAPGEEYLRRRAELGPEEVARRMLASGARQLLVDTGYRADELTTLTRMADWAGAEVREVVRLESVAEEVAAALARGGPAASAAGAYADAFAEALDRHREAVGWKSVAAYRCGLDIDWRRPTPGEVRRAAAEWLAAGPTERGGGTRWRLEHSALIRHGVWSALDTGRPVQFHTGFGDSDASLLGSNPAWLSGLIEDSAEQGTPIVLLHTWPHHREAGYLAQVWPHVYMDVGETLPHVGHRGGAVLAEALELAPWHKVLYSSDAFGLAELYHLGARTHRAALVGALEPLAAMGFDRAELGRLAGLVCAGNARRIYPGLGL